MPQINQEIQKLSPSAAISLFSLDATKIGGSILNFTGMTAGAAPVVYRGVTYTPIEVEFTGFETSGTGALPRPVMRLANTDGIIQAIVNTWGDLNGCTVTRIRTFERFLDGKPEADSASFFGPDVFEVDQKISDTPTVIEWELSAAIDQQGRYIGRSIIRDTCLSRYRSYNPVTGLFDYSKAVCPYAGSAYFDVNDNPVGTAAQDVPSRRLNCCKVRFGASNKLPFGGFPGASRTLS